ncbi:MAG: trigger factor [Bryobacterales bacterium]|nr:trigger factor [Bryobacterales bacterium]
MSDDCKRTLEISIPVEEVEKTTRHVVEELGTRVKIPGFRPGKVPADVVLKRFKDQVRQDVLDHLLGPAFNRKADELALHVVGRPTVKDLKYEEGQPVEFTAEFEVRPEFELQDYDNLTVPYEEPQVSEEDVDARLASLREQRAELVNVDPRPVEEGDFAVIALESLSSVGTEEPIKQDEMNLEVGGEYTLPEFTENVKGMEVGDTKEFDVVYPGDYSGRNLAGRTVTFRVTLNGLRKREMPELNDEFAQDMGDYKTLDDLKENVRRSILAEREFVARERSKEAIVALLSDAYSFPVPEAYVSQQIDSQVRRQIRNLAAQGADMNNVQIDWDKVIEEQREPAAKSVRVGMVIEKIAAAESVEVLEKEVNDEVARIARRENVAPAALRERIEKDGSIVRIAQQIQTEKTLNLLLERATKVAPAPKAEDSEAEAPEAGSAA